jgi:hypothetical protein
MLKLILNHDHDLENPCDNDGWKVHSFGRRHANFRDPETLGLSYSLDPSTGLPKVMNPGLRSKLKHGLAFFLSYFEHGNCVWFLHGDEPAGVEFRWDGVKVAGLIVWEGKPGDLGPRTLEARRNDADAFLKTYTSWCNGEGYGYSVEDQDGQHVDSCFGFYGADVEYMFDQLRPHLNGEHYEVGGDAAWLAKYHLSK